MYKDKALQRKTTAERVRRYRALHIDPKDVTQGKALQEGITDRVLPQPVKTNSAGANVEPRIEPDRPEPIVARDTSGEVTYSNDPWAARVSKPKLPAAIKSGKCSSDDTRLLFSKSRQLSKVGLR